MGKLELFDNKNSVNDNNIEDHECKHSQYESL